ncbi:DeoR/GlpR family DNA-binding transcription regulator [Brevibacillus dissolubilis]|uniref:DeoR/GlpR family DNA-binding transcription regulator n=1 Tax=Brevibacillus dissolubilis TaxID=1844116 RepID=UPI00111644CB|nr:DeoR/GlpR family DNA-binding transcription regulator [Brevibacillus dissolubilis]
MLTPERQQAILELLQKQGFARLPELIQLTGASDSTIRRDLNELEAQKKIRRVHGGAQLLEGKVEESTVAEKSLKHDREKSLIAAYAATKVKRGDSLFLDAGTTTLQMIPHLPPDILVVTNGVNTALRLLEHQIQTILIGGKLKPSTLSMVGNGAITGLSMYRFDHCFLGMNGVDLGRGLTTPDPEEAFVKTTALRLSDEKYVLADSSKFGNVTFAHVAEVQDAVIITDDDLAEEDRQLWMQTAKIEVVPL